MKRSIRNSLIIIAALLLFLTACIVPQTRPGQAAPAAQSSGIDLWTAPPETKNPDSAPANIQQSASTETHASPEATAREEITEAPLSSAPAENTPSPSPVIAEDGIYTSKEDVALYLHTYGHLPPNFITKKEAQSLGWPGGDLRPYAPGKCIGGDYFGNYERLLPTKKGRSYYECDIDTLNRRSRGSKRIVWSNDGLIYYTDDHFESFTLLYGGE